MWDCWTDLLTHQNWRWNPHRQMASEHFWIEISIGLNYWLLVAWMIRASIFEPSPNDPKIGGPRRNPSGAGLLKGSVDEQQGFFLDALGLLLHSWLYFRLFIFVPFQIAQITCRKPGTPCILEEKPGFPGPWKHNPSWVPKNPMISAEESQYQPDHLAISSGRQGTSMGLRLSWVVKNGQH